MKKILAPTDFSDAAANAVDYAARLALQSGARLVLFHAFHTAPVVVDFPVTDLSLAEIRAQSMYTLRKIRDEISAVHPGLDIACENACGFAVDEINDFALENDIDLIVMGMQGHSYVSEKVVGSTTTALMRDAPCPVLVVGKNIRFREIRRIVLACDYVKVPGYTAIDRLKVFAGLFSAPWVYVLHIVGRKAGPPSLLEHLSIPRLRELLHETAHSFHTLENGDIVDGINGFVEKNGADLVAMIPRRHSVWRSMFYSSLTKRMAFHASVPLLILQQTA